MQHFLSPEIRNCLLVIFLEHLISVEMLCCPWQAWLVERIDLHLWLHSLVVWEIVGCAKLPLLEVFQSQTMTEQNVSLFTLCMGQYKVFVLDFLQFFYFMLNYRVSSIRIDWFGWNRRIKPGVQMLVLILIFDNKFFLWFCNFPSQDVWNFLLDNFRWLIFPTAKFVRKQITSLIVKGVMLIEVFLFFWVVLKAWKFGWCLRLVENVIRT